MNTKRTWMPISTLMPGSTLMPPTTLLDATSRYPELDELRHQYQNFVKPGQPLDAVQDDPEALVAAKQLATGALNTAKDKIRIVKPWLRNRIRLASIIQLAGNIVGAIASAGVISAVLLDSRPAAIITAIITFSSSCSLMISQYLLKPFVRGNVTLSDWYTDLTDIIPEFDSLLYQVSAARESQEISNLHKKANDILSKVTHIAEAIDDPKLLSSLDLGRAGGTQRF